LRSVRHPSLVAYPCIDINDYQVARSRRADDEIVSRL
jgi:hypothetical protein